MTTAAPPRPDSPHATPSAPSQPATSHGDAALRVAILGGGPAGSTLGALLADRGMHVVLFDDGRRPEMIVGESLIPAIVPILRRLGIEQQVADLGVLKPGVSFLRPGHEPLHLSFDPLGDRLPQYAYNVPRPAFDDLLRDRAQQSDVTLAPFPAQVEREAQQPDAVRLTQETLAKVPQLQGQQPDLIVDCTGRKRLIARLLDLPTVDGKRRDVAHFAHYENFCLDGLPEGQVVTGLMKRGWSWCIPLRDRVSVGVVLRNEDIRAFGKTPEEQLAGVIADDPQLGPRAREARRVTEVLTYTNYQKMTQRGFGPNWVLMGDALGFVDPMFSPGLFLAMRSAELLADQLEGVCRRRGAIRRTGDASPVAGRAFQRALARYTREMEGWFVAWTELIELIYSGQVLALREAGTEWASMHPGRVSDWISRHMEKQMACMAAGEATRSRYAWSLLRFGTRYGMRGKDPSLYQVV